MVRAVDLLVPRDRPVTERLAVARQLAREMPAEALRVGPIALDESIADSEFVDRYLNVNETRYEVASLWGLLARHGLRFLRWVVPADWTLPARTPAIKKHEMADRTTRKNSGTRWAGGNRGL